MSVPVILRAAPVCTMADRIDPQGVRHFEMYEPWSLGPMPGRELRDIPVRIDHDKHAAPIGHVTALRTEEDHNRGTWFLVHALLDDPPAWLQKGGAVSLSRAAFHTRDLGAGWDLIDKAVFTEISLLSPGTKPAHPRAAVLWIGEPVRRDEPQVIHTTGTIRRPCGVVLGVR